MSTSEYRFNPETKVLETIPYNAKQSLAPTVENIMLLKQDHAKFLVDGLDVSNIIYNKVSKLYAAPHRQKEELTWQSLRALLASKSRDKFLLSNKAIRLIKEGFSHTDISEALKVPVDIVKTWSEQLGITKSPKKNYKFHTEDQKNEMRKFITENRNMMSNAQISEALGISTSTIWTLLNPEKAQKNEETRRIREEKGLAVPRISKTAPTTEKAPKVMKRKYTRKAVPSASTVITEPLALPPSPKTCRRCEQYQAEKVLTDNILRNNIELLDKTKEHYDTTLRELKDDRDFFRNLLNKVVK